MTACVQKIVAPLSALTLFSFIENIYKISVSLTVTWGNDVYDNNNICDVLSLISVISPVPIFTNCLSHTYTYFYKRQYFLSIIFIV